VRTLLIDADSECFAAAAVAEDKRIVAMREDGALTGPFPNVKAVTESLGKEPAATAVLFRSHEVHTEESAITLLDARLRRIVHQAQERYGEVRPELWLSGKINFRHLVDPLYKGGRDSTPKPYWLARLKQHCVTHWRARMTRTWEADDEIGIRAFELGAENYIVCSLDKDLKQIPGRHIIIGKGHLDMSARGSLMRLYVQILAGDNTDNIKGCYQQGQGDDYATAFAYLEPFLDGGERALWAATVAKYQASLDKYGPDRCGYIDARGAALHTAQLVYILRDRPKGDIPPRWTPPDLEDL
jgi:hypothetical protein